MGIANQNKLPDFSLIEKSGILSIHRVTFQLYIFLQHSSGSVVAVGGVVVASVLLKKGTSSHLAKVIQEAAPKPEKCFKGVPLSKLTELAKQIYHGLYCSIDE